MRLSIQEGKEKGGVSEASAAAGGQRREEIANKKGEIAVCPRTVHAKLKMNGYRCRVFGGARHRLLAMMACLVVQVGCHSAIWPNL